jgi:hypothetical protein
MSGRISKNLRSGFLHEELGILLIRQVAVVAPVPRPDDIGTDGIATLLRPPQGILQYADSSFYVQFKALSVDEVRYNYNPQTNQPQERGELAWLRELQLPFFIGSVDDADSSIRLYTTQNAYAELIRNDAAATLRLRFGPEPDLLAGDGGEGVGAVGGADDNAPEDADDAHPIVYLGPPIFEWTMVSHKAQGFYANAYSILKPWLDLEHTNCFSRPLKLLQKAIWATGQAPTMPDDHVLVTTSVNGPGDAVTILRAMKPVIRCLLLDRLIRGTDAQVEILDSLIELSRALTVDPCSEGLRATLEAAAAVAKQALGAAND